MDVTDMPGKEEVSEERRLEQLKLIYDYVKFHIGLYLATPAVFVVLAGGIEVETHDYFFVGLCSMIFVYLLAGGHAAWFMGNNINTKWKPGFLDTFEAAAFHKYRRYIHHWLYWLGIAFGLLGLIASYRSLH